MGIEAFCPNGHRMRVKDHLAGRLGVCPTCGSRFRLPDVSMERPPASDVVATESASAAAAVPLPIARSLPLDPSVVSSLPRAVPYEGGPAPHASIPTSTAAALQVPLGRVPLGQVPLGHAIPGTTPVTTPGNAVPPTAVPPTVEPDGPWPSETVAPDPPAVDPVAEWAVPARSPRTVRRHRRDSGGGVLAVVLLIVVAAAGLVAWMVLRSRGVIP